MLQLASLPPRVCTLVLLIYVVGIPIPVRLYIATPGWCCSLLKQKISPLSCLQLGSTALHLAAQKGKADVVRLLIEAGAQLDIQNTVCAILALSNAESIGLLRWLVARCICIPKALPISKFILSIYCNKYWPPTLCITKPFDCPYDTHPYLIFLYVILWSFLRLVKERVIHAVYLRMYHPLVSFSV